MIDSPNPVQGMFGDPTVFYGTSASRLTSNKKESEGATLSDAPIDGPLTAGEVTAQRRPKGVAGFVKTPAGAMLLLFIPAYIIFHKTFGSGA